MRKSLRIRLFASMLIMLLIVIVALGFLLETVVARELEQNEIDNHVNANNYIKSNFDLIMDLVYSTTLAISSRGDMEELLSMQVGPLNKQIYRAKQRELASALRASIEMQHYIRSIHLIGVNGAKFSSVGNLDAYLAESWGKYYPRFQSGKDGTAWISALEDVNYSADKTTRVISYLRAVYSLEDSTIIGLCIVHINYEFLNELLTISSIKSGEKIFVVNREGQILLNHPAVIDMSSVLRENPQILSEENARFEGAVFKVPSLLVSDSIERTDWKIVRVIPMAKITSETLKLRYTWLSLIAILLIVCLLTSAILAQNINRPVQDLSKAFEKVEAGNLGVRVNEDRKDELGKLAQSFNVMVEKLEKSFQNELLMQKRKSEVEFDILQAQINPHFLYNTLDSIKWLAVIQNVDNIADMSTALIQLLKYNLATGRAIVSLQDEVESLKHYVKIQKYRYGDMFSFMTAIAPETKNCQMLRFILQPLVENCIVHAFDQGVKGQTIRVISFVQGEELHVEVIDNGAGMDIKRLESLSTDRGEKEKRFNHIGVQNIRERIRLYFGQEYDLYYVSAPKAGTIVEIVLPLRFMEEDMDSNL